MSTPVCLIAGAMGHQDKTMSIVCLNRTEQQKQQHSQLNGMGVLEMNMELLSRGGLFQMIFLYQLGDF